jgi:hypothetical protein
VAYVIIKEFVNIRIVNGFPSEPIVILGIPVILKGTHLHAFKRLPQLAHLLLHSPHHLLELLELDSQRSLRSLDVSLVVLEKPCGSQLNPREHAISTLKKKKMKVGSRVKLPKSLLGQTYRL